MKDKVKAMFDRAPVSINCQQGDPFQKTQWENTKEKILEMNICKHKGPVAVITKSIITDEQIEWMNRYITDINFFIYFSITGLQEKYTLDVILERFKYVSEHCAQNKRIRPITFIRPIIPGKNDKVQMLKPIIETAACYSAGKAIIFRGYKDVENGETPVPLNPNFVEDFRKACSESGAVILNKSRELVAFSGVDTVMADDPLSEEETNEFLRFVGYDWMEVNSDGDIIRTNDRRLTKGDIHFIQMFTKRKVIVPDINYESLRSLLSIDLFGKKNIDATSSWLGWGENRPCAIGCPYCIAHVKDYEKFGTNFNTILE